MHVRWHNLWALITIAPFCVFRVLSKANYAYLLQFMWPQSGRNWKLCKVAGNSIICMHFWTLRLPGLEFF